MVLVLCFDVAMLVLYVRCIVYVVSYHTWYGGLENIQVLARYSVVVVAVSFIHSFVTSYHKDESFDSWP